MKYNRALPKFVLLGVMAGLLAACSTVAPQPTATADQGLVETAVSAGQTQAAQTIEAQLTQTAAALPTATSTLAFTDTPVPTDTAVPVVLPTSTPTRAPTIPYPTITSTPGAFACAVTATSISYGKQMSPGNDFDGSWTFKNIGTSIWDPHEVDFAYVSGTKFQKNTDRMDLPEATGPGESVTVVVDMLAPTTDGVYTTTWALTGQGGANWCQVTMYIEVK